jgi:hypothetical protein
MSKNPPRNSNSSIAGLLAGIFAGLVRRRKQGPGGTPIRIVSMPTSEPIERSTGKGSEKLRGAAGQGDVRSLSDLGKLSAMGVLQVVEDLFIAGYMHRAIERGENVTVNDAELAFSDELIARGWITDLNADSPHYIN